MTTKDKSENLIEPQLVQRLSCPHEVVHMYHRPNRFGFLFLSNSDQINNDFVQTTTVFLSLHSYSRKFSRSFYREQPKQLVQTFSKIYSYFHPAHYIADDTPWFFFFLRPVSCIFRRLARNSKNVIDCKYKIVKCYVNKYLL